MIEEKDNNKTNIPEDELDDLGVLGEDIKPEVKTEVEKKVKQPITKEEYELVRKEYEEDKLRKQESKKKFSFNKIFPYKKRQAMNKSNKKADNILVFLLTMKKELVFVVTKIYGGGFLVIRNKVYRFNPSKVFTFGKYKAVIAREFDRELIGFEDYSELVIKDYLSEHPGERININDPVLIKAVIMAHLSEKQKMGGNTKWIIIALVVLGLIVGALVVFGGKKTNTNANIVNGSAIYTPPK